MPYNSDDEEEMELESSSIVEVLEEEEEEISRAATASAAADDDDDSTEEDDDDDDTDSESENELSSSAPTPSSSVAAPNPPKIRIKLKMPKKNEPTAASDAGTAASTKNERASPSPSTLANSSKPPSPSEDVVISVSGNRRKPSLPLKRLPTAGLLKKPTGDSSSLGGSSSGKKSRIRSLKLPFSKKKDDDDDDAVTAEVVSTGRLTPGGVGPYTKRRSMNPSKPVKLPPLISPGLIVTQSSGKKITPAELFDEAMKGAGYTETNRTERPHRGSSVQKKVGDVFDSNVKLTMHFPDLVPKELWDTREDHDGDVVMKESTANRFSPDDLIRELSDAMQPNEISKRNTLSIDEMLPISLTMPLPDSYLEERRNYVRAVEEREKAIAAKQAAEEDAEFNGADPPTVTVPPIPIPPEPPRLETVDTSIIKDEHPLYPPKQVSLVSHLDPQTFHVTEGRYFGLLSNKIADPNYCGPNALTSTAGSALATAGSAAYASPLILSSMLFSNHPPPTAALNPNNALSSSNANNSNNKSQPNAVTSGGETSDAGMEPTVQPSTVSSSKETKKDPVVKAAVDVKKSAPSVTSSGNKDKKKGPVPTASTASLRKIMEEGGEVAAAMRLTIIRAAVYASRTGGHGQSFVTPSGDVYPDIGKAFAAHAGIKPCERCKSNKQGSYHCRLRRKHTDADFDGGNSSAILRELQDEPVERLAPSVDAMIVD